MRKWILLLVAPLSLATLAIVLLTAPTLVPARGPLARSPSPAAGARGPRMSPPAHRSWDAGLSRTYKLELTTRIVGDARPVELRVGGAWKATVVDGDDEHAMLRLQLAYPAATSDGQPAPPDMLAELGRPWFVELDGDGRIEAAWFEVGVGRAARDVLKSVAAYLQYASPGAAAGRVEQDSTGTYQAAYTPGDAPAGARALARTKARYVSIATARGPAAPGDVGGPEVKGSAARFELDDDGWPARVTLEEQLVVAVPESAQRLTADVALRAERTGSGRREELAGAFGAARAGLRRYAPLAEPPDARDLAATHDRQEIGGASYQQLIDELRGARDAHAEAAAQRRLRALFALHPDDARRAAELLRDSSLTVSGKKTLIAALAGAGSPEAQAALVDSLATPSTTELRQQTLASLGLTPTPTPATLRALQALVDAPADPADRSTALLAVGNAAHTGTAAGDAAAGDAVAWLLERLQRAASSDEAIGYLRALGNTADPRALPALGDRLQSADPAIRAAAVAALRLIDAPAVDDVLGTVLLGDSDGRVRAEAVFAATYRTVAPLLPALEGALLRDPEPQVRIRIVELLGRRRSESAACAPLLSRAAQGDRDPQVRSAAAKALES